MAEKIRLQRTISEQESSSKVVSKTFTTFVQSDTQQDLDTVNELFRLYDKLYLDIPLSGAQSHSYLIQESSKLVEVQQNNEEIQPLLDEISELRERLLVANRQLIELQTQPNE